MSNSGKSNIEISETKTVINRTSECARETTSGAFAHSDTVLFRLKIPRSVGAVSVEMTIWQDAYAYEDMKKIISFSWRSLSLGYDVYECEIPLESLFMSKKVETSGLFYYHYIITSNGVDTYPAGSDKQLLLYDDSYATPDWLKGGIIYHIFVDRFSKGKTAPRVKKNARIDADWDNGIPQYGEYPGADVDNNVFFGGTLDGVTDKLDYIESLGVNCIYLSPVFDAASNHKYDTADYLSVDSMFGGDKALARLISEAGKRFIKIILDGVFNHTGSDSVYFNQKGTYKSIGAYQSKESPYYDWYNFQEYPDKYDSWWGVKILPRVNCDNESYKRFIFSEVVEKWMNIGVFGWRLDVADELSDEFLEELRATVKSKNSDAVIIGEVWENASNKISYGKRRKYLRGNSLDSVMNYPLRDAIIAFIKHGDFKKITETADMLYTDYPKQSADTLMNVLSTHDTERIITTLAGVDCGDKTNKELSEMKLSPAQREKGIALLKLAYIILATMPGVCCLFYGDETGIEGYRDPFCRRPYPWNKQDADLIKFFSEIGKIRRTTEAFTDGSYSLIYANEDIFCYERSTANQRVITVINRSENRYKLSSDCALYDLHKQKKTASSQIINSQSGYIFKIPAKENLNIYFSV